MALVRMKPPVGVSVGLGADDKLYYIDGQGFANVDSGSVTKLTAEGWVSAVPVAPEAPGNTFPVSATKTLTGVIKNSGVGGVVPLGNVKQLNSALRYFYGRYGSLTNDATGYSYHHVEELPVVPDAIRIILANTQTTGTANFQVGAALQANVSDTIGNGLTYTYANWTDGNTGALTVAQVSNAAAAAYPKYLVSDPIPLMPVARDDGVAGSVLALRCFVRTTTVTATMVGNGTTDNWIDQGTREAGKRKWCKRKIGQHLASPATFTSPTDTNQSPIAGIIYYAQGQVVNVARFGDSTDTGIETLFGIGWARRACEDLTGGGIVFEDAAFCRAGTDALTYGQVATDAMDAFGKYISTAFVKLGTPNSVTGTIDATELGNCKIAAGNMLAKCAEKSIVPIVVTWPPSNPSTGSPVGIKDYGSSDSLRRDYNAPYIATATLPMLDMSTVMNGATDGAGQVNIAAGMTDDGIHPNVACNLILRDIAKQILRGAVF